MIQNTSLFSIISFKYIFLFFGCGKVIDLIFDIEKVQQNTRKL